MAASPEHSIPGVSHFAANFPRRNSLPLLSMATDGQRMPSGERRLSQQDLHSGYHPSYLQGNSSAANHSPSWSPHQILESRGQYKQSHPRPHNSESLLHRPSSPHEQSVESYPNGGQSSNTMVEASSATFKTDMEYRIGQEYEGSSGRPHHMALAAAPTLAHHRQQQQQQQHPNPYYQYHCQPQYDHLGYGDDNDDSHCNEKEGAFPDKHRNNSISSSTSSTSSVSHLHMQNHPGSNNKHPCKFPTCGWSFKRFEHLKRHMLVHTKERPFICEFQGCDKSFSRSDNFSAHLRTHTKKSSMQMGKLDRQHQQFRTQQQHHHEQLQSQMMAVDSMGYLASSSTAPGMMSPTRADRYDDTRHGHLPMHHYQGAADGFLPSGVMSALAHEGNGGGVLMDDRRGVPRNSGLFNEGTATFPNSGPRTSLSTMADHGGHYSSQNSKLIPRPRYHEDSMNDQDPRSTFGLTPSHHQHSSTSLHPLDSPGVANVPGTETDFSPIRLDLKAVSNNPKDVELHNQHNIRTESLYQYTRHQKQGSSYSDLGQHHRQDSSSRERYFIGDGNVGAMDVGGHGSMVVLGSSHDEPNPNPNGESPEQPSRKSSPGPNQHSSSRHAGAWSIDHHGKGGDGIEDSKDEVEVDEENDDDDEEEGDEGEEMDRGQAPIGLSNSFSSFHSHFVPASGGREEQSPPPPSVTLRSHSEGNLSSNPFIQAEGLNRTTDTFIDRHPSLSSSSGGHGGYEGEYLHRHSISGYGPSTTAALSSMSSSIIPPQPAMWPSAVQLHPSQPHDPYGLPPMQHYHEESQYSHHPRFPFQRSHIPPTAPHGHHHHTLQGRARPISSAKNHGCFIPGCMKRFKRLEHLKRHIKTHTLERPFACTTPGCNKRFSRSDNLSQHIKTHQRQLVSKSHWKQPQLPPHQQDIQHQSYHQHQYQQTSQHPHTPSLHHTSLMGVNMEASGHGGHPFVDVSRQPTYQHPGQQQHQQQIHTFYQHRQAYQESSAEY